jgi:hypothetical protein
MARNPALASGYDDQWECRLAAVPMRVRPNEAVTLIVTLSHPRFGDLPPEDCPIFHDRGFLFEYDCDDPRLKPYVKSHNGKGRNPVVIPRMPSLPEGDYCIRVRVTPVHDFVTFRGDLEERLRTGDWPGLPEHLTASASISMVAQQIEASVSLQRSASLPTDDQALWAAIRNRTEAISFSRYQMFIDQVFGQGGPPLDGVQSVRDALERHRFGIGDPQRVVLGTHAYGVLKLATQAFLTLECGVFLKDQTLFDTEKETVRFGDPSLTLDGLEERLKHYLVHPESQISALPYLRRIASAFLSLDRIDHRDRRDAYPSLDNILRQRLTAPSMIELIWSYWQEEGMLVQTMNAIARRFQNRRGSEKDPLGELEFDTLRPLNNVLWGYIQDEQNRLTVPRRAHEYHHHYGLSLEGKAVSGIYPADSRSKFIEAFHNLLYRTELFYREDRDTTMIADAFPLLNALKEVHLLLAEGAHNQFGDLTWTARCEMLITQWMLARPEMREFLRGRYAVPYQEPWMGAVDAMKRLQGWGDTSITHFHELAVTGERILLSIRYGDWVNINNIEEQAKNWARNSKPEVQRYLHDYRTVTGVDLTSDTTDTRDAAARFVQPSALLQRRLTSQRTGAIAPRDGGLRALRPPVPTAVDMPSKPMARLPRRGAAADQ